MIPVVLSLLVFWAIDSATVQAQKEDAATAAAEGSRFYELGDFKSAAGQWSSAAELYRDQPVKRTEVLLDLAAAYQRLGRFQTASEVVAEVLGMPDAPPQIRAAALNLRGTFATAQRQYGAALSAFSESLAIAERINARSLAAMILNNMGNAQAWRGENQRALEQFNRSARLAEELNETALAARACVNGFQAARQLNDWTGAAERAEKAERHIRSLDASGDQATLLLSLGRGHAQWGGPDPDAAHQRQARELYLQAHHVAEDIQDARSLSYALGYLGELYERDRQHAQALDLFRRALAPARRSAAAEALYLWQWGCGRAHAELKERPAALQCYRDAIRTLHPIRRNLALGKPASPGRPGSALFSELSDLLLGAAADQTEDRESQGLLQEVRDIRESLKSAQLEDYFQDDCVESALSTARPVDTLEEDTAVLYAVPLPDRTELLLSLPHGRMKQFRVPVTAAELTSTVRDFRSLLEKRVTYEFLNPARQLHDWLIAPLEETLRSDGVQTLVFAPDGELGTIPMSALFDGDQFLVERFTIAVVPGLKLLGPKPIRQTPRHALLAGVSDPVQGFPGLDHVLAELRAAEAQLGGILLLNADFHNQRLDEAFEKNAFSIVHIASHGEFDGDARRTFLLTHNGRLTLDQLERLIKPSQFRGQPVELLTLSACHTAAGDERAALGLAGVALKAGARSALATLWSVNDEAASTLISSFYRNLQRDEEGVSKAGALRAAQRALMAEPRYDHPAYWSPYLIIGNWL